MKRQHVLAGVLFACATAAAASKTMTANGDWATAANWSPTGVPAAGDTVTIDGRTVSITGGSGYSLNGLTVSGTGPAVSLSGKVYFANNANAFSWTQTGGSFYADVDEFELGKSGAGNRSIDFHATDVTFLHRVILGRASTADKCVYSQHGGTLTINTTTGTNKGFFIGTGSGGAALSLSNVTMTVDGGFTVANGTARCAVDIDKSDVTFNSNLMLGNPNDSKAEFRIRNSTLTLGGDLMTGTKTVSRQQTYAQISNCTVNVVGSHTISVGSGINSTSRIEVVESVWPAPDALALSIGATTGAVGAFRFQDMNQPLPAAWAGFDTSAGADGTLELVNAPSTFSGNVIIGGSSDTSQTLLLAGGRYDLGLSCDIGEKGNGRLVLNDATLSVGANVYSAIQSKTVSNPAKGELLMTNATLDVQRQLILGYNEMDFTTHAVVDADSRICVTNRSNSSSGTMQVARYGNADLELYGTMEVVNLYIGNLSNAVGTVTVNTGSTMKVSSELVLGFTGCGDATLGGPVGTINQKGGTVNASGGKFLLGGNNGSFRDTLGIYRISGGELTSTAVLQLGIYGEGRLILEGGTATVPQVKTSTATGTGTIWFDGGVLKVKDGSHPNDFVQAGVAMKVCDGGAIVHSDYDVTIPAAFAHDGGAEAPAKDGGIVKKGAGTLTVTSTPTFTGDVRVEAGTLDLSGTSFALGADAAIGGGGMLVPPSGGLTVTGAFTLDPTNAPTLTVSGPVTIGAGATVAVTDATLLNSKTSYRLYTATATSGAPELVGFPRGWMAANDGTSLRVFYASGTTIIFR